MTKELIHLFFKENFSFSRFLGFNYKKEKLEGDSDYSGY